VGKQFQAQRAKTEILGRPLKGGAGQNFSMKGGDWVPSSVLQRKRGRAMTNGWGGGYLSKWGVRMEWQRDVEKKLGLRTFRQKKAEGVKIRPGGSKRCLGFITFERHRHRTFVLPKRARKKDIDWIGMACTNPDYAYCSVFGGKRNAFFQVWKGARRALNQTAREFLCCKQEWVNLTAQEHGPIKKLEEGAPTLLGLRRRWKPLEGKTRTTFVG